MRRSLYMRSLMMAVAITVPGILHAGEALTLEEILASSARHYPEVQQALEKVTAAKGAVTAARGAFDLRIDSNAGSRLNGYYEGDYGGAQLVKPLPGMNAQIYGGYRLSDGNFPVYEDQQITTDGGEASIGVALSLLRDRAIDSDRATLYQKQIEKEIADLSVLKTRLSVQRRAMQSYAKWVAAGETLKVYKNLLRLAEKRNDALSQRAAKGDIAQITVTENQQFILQRQAALREAERQFTNASNDLALFWRDEHGKMQPITPKMLPAAESISIGNTALAKGDDAIRALIEKRPDISLLERSIASEDINREMGENSLLPKLDVKIENNNDFGTGDIQGREGNESKLGLNLSIPLQTRYGRGQIQKAEASMRGLRHELRLLEDQLVTEVKNMEENLKTAQQILRISEQEVSVTQTMERAEQERFQSGRSDFFVVNMREINTANASIKNIEARQKYLQSLADYYAATVATEPLGL